jgi:uncharacterized membrane protein YhaH (DUF805 family)
MMKPRSRIKSKTYWLGFIVSMLGFLEFNLHLITDQIGQENFGIVLFVISFLIFILREMTSKPVGRYEDDTK